MEEILHLENQILKAIDSKNATSIQDILHLVEAFPMSFDILKKTQISRLVGKLRKHAHPSISHSSTRIVNTWKNLASDKSEVEGTNYSSIKLEDFLAMDLSLHRKRNKIFNPSISCSNDRVRSLKQGESSTGNVIYWMSRDQRIDDNWAIIKAQEIALKQSSSLAIVFSLSPNFLGATIRQYGFMLRNLKMLEIDAKELNIPFYLLLGTPEQTIPTFCNINNVNTIVTDFSPLRKSKEWKNSLCQILPSNVTVLEVDAHNVSPCWKVSPKCEFSAATIRNKIHNALETYMTELPAVISHPYTSEWKDIDTPSSTSTSTATSSKSKAKGNAKQEDSQTTILPPSAPLSSSSTTHHDNQWANSLSHLHIDTTSPEVTWIQTGERAAYDMLIDFLTSSRRLDRYAEDRNDPVKGANVVSHLSPYMHFGQISAQRILLEVMRLKGFTTLRAMFPSGERTTAVHSFCEELIVRRELADNFCFYNENYDSIDGAHNWAQTTLREHWNDPRTVLYSVEELEYATTKDMLWNAAQNEMVHRGKMHGFMRMYWAKKILEWTPHPDEALRIAIYLNDKYSLDGRDPNGYVGCMWAIAGVHDRAWGERTVFGKIRYMNYDGCKRKFDINAYMKKVKEQCESSKK